MYRRTLSYGTMLTLSLLLIGCGRGCTTSKTIASELRTISTPEGDLDITGRVVDYRNSMPVNRNIFNRSITHTFGLSFDIKFGNFQYEDFFTEGVKDPDLVNLTEELKRVNASVSSDKNHIGLGIDGKVVDIIHLFQSHRITSNNQNLMADGTMDWAKLDINSYPSAEKILMETLENSCDIMDRSDQAMTAFCDSKKASDKVHRILLKKWPECQMAQSYFTDERVERLSKSDKWKRNATKSALKALKNRKVLGSDFDRVVYFAIAVNTPELNAAVDSLLLAEWGKKGGIDYTQALITRMDHTNNPMGKNERQKVYTDAKSEFNKYMQTGQSNPRRSASECLTVLHAFGDTVSAHKFVQDAFVKRPLNFNTSDLIDVAYFDMGNFTDYQQASIIKYSESRFEKSEPLMRSRYYTAMESIVDCSLLKRLKKKYPKELDFNNVPFRCDK